MVIVEALEDAYALQEFSVLFCDQVASQTGRVLQLDPISKFCQENNIILVVDGTQSCQLFFGKSKKQLRNVDFFVMSTHKWISNVKTCRVVIFRDLNSSPCPPAISFGWQQNIKNPTIDKYEPSFNGKVCLIRISLTLYCQKH